MKLPPDVEFHEDIRLLIYRPRGVIDEAAVKRIVSVLEDLEAKLQKPLIDFLIRWQPMKLSSTSNTSFKSPLSPPFLCGHPPVKSAILATDSTLIHYARLHALLTQGSPINVRVFKDRKEAADWLNVAVERLTQNA